MNEQNNVFGSANNAKVDWFNYNSMESIVKNAQQNEDKYAEFKERIVQFEKIKTLEEAKELSEKILPVAKEHNQFKIGDAVCTIVNRPDMFRISLDSAKEFISYDFV